MIGLIIATHGNSSVELIKGAEMFAGPLSQCRAWTLNPGDDIQIALRKENVETVTGVNLPMIIQFVTERETQTLDELVESCIETAQDGIKCPTKIMKERR